MLAVLTKLNLTRNIYYYCRIVDMHMVIIKTTQTPRAAEKLVIHSVNCFEDSTNPSVIIRTLSGISKSFIAF